MLSVILETIIILDLNLPTVLICINSYLDYLFYINCGTNNLWCFSRRRNGNLADGIEISNTAIGCCLTLSLQHAHQSHGSLSCSGSYGSPLQVFFLKTQQFLVWLSKPGHRNSAFLLHTMHCIYPTLTIVLLKEVI